MDQVEAALVAAGNRDDVMLPPLAADAEGSELVTVRRMTFLPAEFCRPVFAQHLTPVQFWCSVCEPVIAAGKQVACRALLDYGRALLMLTHGPAIRPGLVPAIESTYPTICALDEELVAMRMPSLFRDLPGLNHQGRADPNPERAEAIAARIAEAIVANRGPPAAAPAPKTVRDRWPVACTTLLRLCNKADDKVDELPDIWADLSQARKGEERRIIEMALQARAHARFGGGAAANVLITADLSTKVKQLAFLAPEPNDLELGITIFAVLSCLPSSKRKPQLLPPSMTTYMKGPS